LPDITHTNLSPTATIAGADPFDAVRAHIERLVAEGEVPSMAVAVARDGEIVWEEGFGLADRELKVLHLLADGLTYREIADQICVSLNTVRTHVKNIYSKLFVHKRSQAIARARELNLL